MLVLLIFFVASLIGIFRILFVLAGMYKSPVLELFEQYGDPPPVYYPWTQLLIWVGILLFSVSLFWGGGGFQDALGTNLLGVLFLLIAWMSHTFKANVVKVLQELPQFPSWYNKLESYTSRVERRRIAYMWLRLPMRTRWLYNASDKFFFQWVDLVIIATVSDA